ncbi:unnamed protein product [Phytomonas sp. Hart1]|nr:unnamed protein product [Phytomonas sp. Hart1]|eukprot:CCW69156.1 unnamed protein product [Phytomonas sp. isolate Hart1]
MFEFLHSRAAPPGTRCVTPESSILSEYVFFPFYDAIVRYYPRCWVPNTLTLSGIFMTLTSTLLLLSSMPMETGFGSPGISFLPQSLTAADWERASPSSLSFLEVTPYFPWMSPTAQLILCGVLNLLYCIADNTDGRLARRDCKFSGIGEYLDHGLDCVTSLLSTCCVFLVLGYSLSNMATTVCLVAIATELSHTLNYENNIFIWGNRILSVDEAMVFFSLSMWLPLLSPSLINGRISKSHASVICVGFDTCTSMVSRLKWIEILYIFYNIAQLTTLLSLILKNRQMFFRGHTITIVLNSVVFLGLIPRHSAQIAADPRSVVPGYAFSPFSYPALWIITCACASSTIVHIPIAAKCAKLPRTNAIPLLGVLFVWITFAFYPSVGALLAVVLHVSQVLLVIHYIEKTHHPKMA